MVMFLGDEPHEFLEPVTRFEETLVSGIARPEHVNPHGQRRALILLLVFLVVGLGMAGRLLYLTIQRGNLFFWRSEQNRLRETILPAARGEIFDRYGKRLATNTPVVVLGLQPSEFPRDQTKADELTQKLWALYNEGEDLVYVKDHWASYQKHNNLVLVPISLGQASAVRLSLLEQEYPGIMPVALYGREYPLADSAAHVVGYVGVSSEQARPMVVGRGGLEQFYQTVLEGRDGSRLAEVDTYGQTRGVISEASPQSGRSLVTNLDADLQRFVTASLTDGVRTAGARRGAAVVLQPETGEVLALVSYPAFDPNLLLPGQSDSATVSRWLNSSDKPFFFRSIAGLYPPASTIKPLWIAGGLAAGTITDRTIIQDNGFIKVQDPVNNKDYLFWGWKHSGLGAMNVRSALAWSSDIFFYTLLGGYESFVGLGIEQALNILRQVHFGERLGIDLPAEGSGLLPTPAWKERERAERWFLGDTYHIAIGQGDLLATPLQVAGWFAAVANGGTLWRPRVVQRIITQNGKVEQAFAPGILADHLFTPEILAIVRAGLKDVVQTGTARQLATLGLDIAGKTGTAEWGSKGSTPHAWFAGYAPAHDPKLVVVILVERGGEGSATAVPIAGKIFDWYFRQHLPLVQ